MTKQHSNRFGTIDGLRGVAALAVVFFHLSGNLKLELSQLLPDFIMVAFSYGYLGVPVFFVISGFVISLSIGATTITKQYFGTFVLRRSIRLDPTYWVSILLAITLLFIKAKFMGVDFNLPSFASVFSHMFYLQDILEVKPVISVIYWTLCLEVQLYLFYIITLWLNQKATWLSFINTDIKHTILIVLVGILSLLVDYNIISVSIPGLFISSWHYFLMGVLVSNVIRKSPYSTSILTLWLFIELFFQISITIKAYSIAGVVVTLLIYALWKQKKLNSVFTRKEFQFLGAISYTLYLVHPDIGWKVISVGKLLIGNNMSPLLSFILFIVGILASISFAYLLHLIVEKPTLHLCNRLKKSTLREVLLPNKLNGTA